MINRALAHSGEVEEVATGAQDAGGIAFGLPEALLGVMVISALVLLVTLFLKYKEKGDK